MIADVFVILILSCYGHTNATCSLEQTTFRGTKAECRLELQATEEVKHVFGKPTQEPKYRRGKALCMAADMVVLR